MEESETRLRWRQREGEREGGRADDAAVSTAV